MGRRRERWYWDVTYFEGSCVVFIFFVKVIPRHSTRTHDDDSLRYLLIVAWAPSERRRPLFTLLFVSETTFAAESNQTISNPSRESSEKKKTFSPFFPAENKWWEMIQKRKKKKKHVEKDDFAVALVVILVYLYISILCVCASPLSLSFLACVCVCMTHPAWRD